MKSNRIIVTIALVFLLLTASASFAGETWRLASASMPGTTQYQLAEIFCDTVNKLSRGDLTVGLYAAGVLFPVFEAFDNVANGVVEMEVAYGAYWTGKEPGFNLQTRPGCPIHTNAEGAYLDEKLEPFFRKLYEKHGITYLGQFQEAVMYEQLLSVTPINSIDDIKGKKIRTSGIGAQFYRELGASTVSLSSPEIYTAFQTKNIDAAEWTYWDDNMRMGFHEVTAYVLDPAFHCGASESLPLCVNTKKWEALPQHLKDVILTARDKVRYHASMLYNNELIARQKWKESMPNIQYVKWSEADEKKARETGMRLILKMCNDVPDGEEYLEIYRNTLWELGYSDEAKVLGYKE